jgi:hypothetical protein
MAAELLLRDDPMGVLNCRSVADLWNRHQSGGRDFSTPLWALLMFRLWQESYFKNAAAAPLG